MGGPATVAFDRRGGQSQDFLHGQRDALRPCLRQRQMVSVSALVAASKRRVVSVANKPDRYTLLVSQVLECLPDLSGEGIRNGNVLVLIPQWHDEIPNAGPRRLAFPVSHFANGLHSANLDDLDFIRRVRVVRPFAKGLIGGKMPFDWLAGLNRVDLTGGSRGGRQQESNDQH